MRSQMPKQMKSFSESRKSDKSLVTGKSGSTGGGAPPAIKEATPPVEEAVVAEGSDKDGGSVLPKGSPRNPDILKKLGTRKRGGGKAEKKPGKK